ncbi:unnamed protein product [Ixodes persulcatus]
MHKEREREGETNYDSLVRLHGQKKKKKSKKPDLFFLPFRIQYVVELKLLLSALSSSQFGLVPAAIRGTRAKLIVLRCSLSAKETLSRFVFALSLFLPLRVHTKHIRCWRNLLTLYRLQSEIRYAGSDTCV